MAAARDLLWLESQKYTHESDKSSLAEIIGIHSCMAVTRDLLWLESQENTHESDKSSSLARITGLHSWQRKEFFFGWNHKNTLMAVTRVLLWLESQDYNHGSDKSSSLVGITGIHSCINARQLNEHDLKGTNWLLSKALAVVSAKVTIYNVTFLFVLDHAHVPGIETADRLADLTTISEGQSLDHAGIINNHINIGILEDFG